MALDAMDLLARLNGSQQQPASVLDYLLNKGSTVSSMPGAGITSPGPQQTAPVPSPKSSSGVLSNPLFALAASLMANSNQPGVSFANALGSGISAATQQQGKLDEQATTEERMKVWLESIQKKPKPVSMYRTTESGVETISVLPEEVEAMGEKGYTLGTLKTPQQSKLQMRSAKMSGAELRLQGINADPSKVYNVQAQYDPSTGKSVIDPQFITEASNGSTNSKITDSALSRLVGKLTGSDAVIKSLNASGEDASGYVEGAAWTTERAAAYVKQGIAPVAAVNRASKEAKELLGILTDGKQNEAAAGAVNNERTLGWDKRMK